MTRLAIVLLGLASLATAKPSFLSIPLTYLTPLSPGTQVSTNGGGSLDDPEVAAARIAERTGLANGVTRSTVDGSHSPRGQPISLARDGAPPILTSYAPLGTDGRVVDTPEVAAAKAAHAAAHVNERINLANEIARSGGGGGALDSSDIADSESDGRALDAPEVVEVARADGKIDPTANEASRSDDARPRVVNDRVPLVIGTNGVIAALVPVGPDGGPEVAGDQNLANDVRSVDALAVAGPTLAYGRLVY